MKNDELARLVGMKAAEALGAIAHDYDCEPIEVVAAIANELLAMRTLTGIDASRWSVTGPRGRR